ncbi:MAG TPA: DNA alkylation repair protein [Candidatus Limnocylindria bacterium]|nr:DNA alkylation repair protein [Candidatus Limnocylindria bacterium]
MDPAAVADLITDELRAVARPERAEQEKRYLKSDLAFVGASVWEIRRVMQAFSRGASPLTHDRLIALAEALWAEPVHERRMAAVALLELHPKLLTVADLPFVERLIRESLTWALVDGLAADVVGGILAAAPGDVTPILDRWAADPDFWVRRASLLAELRPLRAGAGLAPFLRRADAMLDEKEFFIRKAIGWVLREVGKRRPDEVAAWLAPRTHRASGVTMREAVRHLPAREGERLMAAYRKRRPAG